jgi:hypothetical protein
MKDRLLKYLEAHPVDANGNSSTRWLSKKEPELWEWILKSTPFLLDAKPKQRIWHIINDVYSVPLCPVDGIPVKWHENRYLTYSSRSAKSRSLEVRDKRMSTYKKKTGFDSWNSKSNTDGYQKFKDTNFEKYGCWATEDEELKEQILKTKIANGVCRTNEEKSALELYMLEVENFTKDSWYYSYSRINPEGMQRGKEYHLDHIYSRKAGFDNNVPAKVIGHWTNLRLMPSKDNNGKSSRCDKTIEQLYEDYQNNSKKQ